MLAFFTATVTAAGAVLNPETYAPVLLRERAKRLSKATGKVYRSKYEKNSRIEFERAFRVALSRPWLLLFRESIVFLLAVYLAIIYATLYVS